MSDPTAPGDGASAPDPGPDPTQSAARPRGAHRAPARPQRIVIVGLIAVAAVVALLLAFSSCGGGFESGQGVVNGTPGVTTAPPTSPATSTAPITTTPPATTAPAPSTPPPTTRTAPPTSARPTTQTPSPSPSPTTGPRIPVDVLNGTAVKGLAAQEAARVCSAGWTVASTDNWRRTNVGTTTIFYASGDEGSARRLARELAGAQQIAPAVSGMSTARLTMVIER